MALRTRTWCAISLGLFVASGLLWEVGNKVQESKDPAPSATPIAPASTNKPVSVLPKPNLPPDASRAEISAATRLHNTTVPLRQLTRMDTAILLRNAFIDTASKQPLSIPDALKSDKAPGAYIVQAHGTITDSFRNRISAAGATSVSYIPNNALLVEASEAAAKQLASDPAVNSVMPWEPYYKLDEKLLALAVSSQPLAESSLLRVTLFPSQQSAGRQAILDAGAQILNESAGPFGELLTVKPDPSSWVALARLPAVQGIEPQYHRTAMMDLSRPFLGVSADSVTTNNYLGLTGKKVLVNLNDSGVDSTHPDLQGRVTGLSTPVTDDDGHGTHVAGIIVGNGSMSSRIATNAPGSVPGANFRGIAPEADLYVIPIDLVNGPQDSDSYLTEVAATNHALISNNSWNYPGSDTYDSSAAIYDMAVRDALPMVSGSQPLSYVFSAGNGGAGGPDGTGGEAGTIASPATAKNVITVGALEQPRFITNEVAQLNSETGEIFTNALFYPQTDSSDQVMYASSRGNVSPGTEGDSGRFKPDLVAPGAFVISTRATNWAPNPISTSTIQSPPYTGQEVAPGAWTQNYHVYLPPNAVALQILISAAGTNGALPILGNYDTQADPSTYSISGVGQLNLPADGELIPDADFYWIVGNSGSDFVSYSMVAIVTVTNADNGTFKALKQLNDNLAPYYRYESGTSMAAPAVSGMIALMKEFFEQRLPADLRHTNSPALMKALLINGARSVNNIYDFNVQTSLNLQGWGVPNISNSLPAFLTNTSATSKGAPLQFVDQSVTNALATGERRTWILNLDPSASASPLRATLVWTDPPGNPNAAVKLVNDLDLVITNLDTGEIYWGNDIASENDYNSVRGTNDFGYSDVINNVENVFINTPFVQGTNFSVSVIGKKVNVNAVTDTNRTAQDFALVISCTDLTLTNALTLIYTNSIATNYFALTSVTNGMPLLNERVGANSPLLGGSAGSTNQWHFYVFTNSIDTNSQLGITNGSNVAFITFSSPNLAVPRVTEGDIDLYVSTNAALTNLDAAAIAGADKSLQRGGEELVFYTNSLLGTIYYIGVKAEDQQAAEYGFVALSSVTPFDEGTANGGRIIHGLPVDLVIPDGDARKPGRALMFGVGTLRVTVGRVVVTNVIAHQNLGDLVGNLSHSGKFTVLNNHTLNNGNSSGTNLFIFDDSNNGDILYSRPTDGPGRLDQFTGQASFGAWILSETDDHLTQTGRVVMMDIRIDPLPPIGGLQGQVLPNSFTYYAVDVPLEATNLNVFVWDIKPPLPLNVYVKRAQEPSLTDYDKKALIDPNTQNLSNNLPVLTLGKGDVPPLVPGRYYIGIFNPNAVTVEFKINASLDYDLSGAFAQKFTTNPAVNIPDVARMFATNHVDVDLKIVSLDVGVRINHPRPSDLALHLISPQGLSVLLVEDRGGTSTGGFGAGTTNAATATNSEISYFNFTENTNLTDTLVKFATTPFTLSKTNTTTDSDNFDTYPLGIYTAGQTFGQWSVASNEVEIVSGGLTTSGEALNMHNGTVTRTLTTSGSYKYNVSILYKRSDAMPGAISWWPFGDAYGTNDIIGTNNAAPDTSGFYDVGEVGQGFVFNGVTNYVHIPASPTLNATSFTWEGWLSPNGVNQTSPIFGFSSQTNLGVNLAMAKGVLSADIVDTTGADHNFATTNVFTTNLWYHVALTFDQASGKANLFVDGNLVASNTFAGITPQTTSDLYFGHSPFPPGANFFKGIMDEIVWYNRALSANEIADIAHVGSGGHNLTGNPPLSASVSGTFMIPGIITNILSPTTQWQTSSIAFTASGNTMPLAITSDTGGFLVDLYNLSLESGATYYKAEESLDIFKDTPALGDWILEIEDTRTGALVPPPQLLSWQLSIIFATPAQTAVTLTNATPYCGTVSGNEKQYFIVETPRSASFATNILFNNGTSAMVLAGDQNGLPVGDGSVDDYYLGNILPGTNGTIVLSTNSPIDHPLISGSRYYLAVMNQDPNTTNDFCIEVIFDKTDPINYIHVVKLTNGIPYSASISNGPVLDYYQFDVSTNAISVQFTLFPTNGNLNLVAIKERPVIDPLPTPTKNDASSGRLGTATDFIYLGTNFFDLTTNTTPLLTPGTWYLGVVNMENFPVSYSILAKEKIARLVTLTNGLPLDVSIVPGDLEDYFHFSITETNSEAWFDLTNLSGRGDLILRQNNLPSSITNDALGAVLPSGGREINLYTNGTPTTTGTVDTNTIDFELKPIGTNVILSWVSVVGDTYQVLTITNVTDTNWVILQANIVATDTNTTYDVPDSAKYGFFQVQSITTSPHDLVLTNGLNGEWYAAVLNYEATNLTFTIQAAAIPIFNPIVPGISETNSLQPSPYWKYYTYDISTNTVVSLIQATPLDGDIGLYVRKANTNRLFWPTVLQFDAGSENPGIVAEQVLLATNTTPVALTPGLWYIGVYNPSTNIVNYSLDIYEYTNSPQQLPSGGVVTNLVGTNLMQFYWFVIDTNAYKATVETLNADGNVDLFVRRGLPNPGPGFYDFAGTNGGTTNEFITIQTNATPIPLTPGLWVIGVSNADTNPVAYSLRATQFVTATSNQWIDDIHVKLTNGFIYLSWPSTVGTRYRVDGCTNIVVPTWITVTNIASATSTTTTVAIPLTSGLRYFRILQFGTTPVPPGTNTVSVVGSKITVTNGFIDISWPSTVGAAYRVDGSTNIVNAKWIVVTNVASAVATNTSIRVPISLGLHFFNVLQLGATNEIPNTNSVSLDNLLVSVTSKTISITWDSTVGKTYQVEGTTNIVNPEWITVTNIASAASSKTTVIIPLSTGLQYFNVIEVGSGNGGGGTTNTPPTINVSVLQKPTAGGFVLQWTATPGQKFQVRYTDALKSTGTVWTTLPGTITAPASGACTFTDTTAPTNQPRYYQLILVP